MNENSLQKRDITERIKQLADLFTKGCESFVEAGMVAASIVDEFGEEGIEAVLKLCPALTHETFVRFEQVGRQRLHPLCLMKGGEAMERLSIFPFESQAHIIKNGVELLVEGGETLKVEPWNLTPDQVNQVFARNRLRSLAEQAAWIRDRMERARLRNIQEPVTIDQPYRIHKGKIEIMHEGRAVAILEKKDLLRMLNDLVN